MIGPQLAAYAGGFKEFKRQAGHSEVRNASQPLKKSVSLSTSEEISKSL